MTKRDLSLWLFHIELLDTDRSEVYYVFKRILLPNTHQHKFKFSVDTITNHSHPSVFVGDWFQEPLEQLSYILTSKGSEQGPKIMRELAVHDIPLCICLAIYQVKNTTTVSISCVSWIEWWWNGWASMYSKYCRVGCQVLWAHTKEWNVWLMQWMYFYIF